MWGHKRSAVDDLREQIKEEAAERRAALRALEERIAKLEQTGVSASPESGPLGEEEQPPDSSYTPLKESGRSEAEGHHRESRIPLLKDVKHLASDLVDDMTDSKSNSYQIEESCWDACLFAFLPPMTAGPSTNLTILFLLNIITQFFFIFVIYKFMCEDPLSQDLLESLLRFRLGVAHNVQYADATTGTSLIRLVCNEDQKIPYAGAQSALVGDISVSKDGGMYLCTLAVLCWIVINMKEFDSSFSFMCAVLSLGDRGRGSGTRLVAAGQDEGLVLECISRRRCVIVMLVAAIPRLFVVAALLYTGTVFLATTVSMGDLLMNSLALAFIVDVDNLLYQAFATKRLRTMVSQVGPIQHEPQGTRLLGWILGSGLKILGAALQMFTAFFILIWPFHLRMNQAYDILCTGRQDFVYSVNTATNLVQVTPSFPRAGSGWTNEELSVLSVARPSLRSGAGFSVPKPLLDGADVKRPVIYLLGHSDAMKSLPNVTSVPKRMQPHMDLLSSLRLMDTLPVAEQVSDFPCADVTVANTGIPADHLATVTHGPVSCEEAKHLCDLPNMTTLRVLCPATCGCGMLEDPPAAFFAGPGFGCPPKCRFGLRSELQNASGYPCHDVQPSTFIGDKSLKRYFSSFLDFFSKSESLMVLRQAIRADGPTVGIPRDQSDAVVTSIVSQRFLTNILERGRWHLAPGIPHPRGLQGCEFWTSWEVAWIFNLDFCSTEKWRSIRLQCPDSCKCSGRDREQCPKTCKSEL